MKENEAIPIFIKSQPEDKPKIAASKYSREEWLAVVQESTGQQAFAHQLKH
jgi:hypothetical protein